MVESILYLRLVVVKKIDHREHRMAKNAVVSEELASKFATEKSPYLRWVRDEGLDIIGAHYVANLRTVELKPWARRGGSAYSSTTRHRLLRTIVMCAKFPRAESSRRSASCTRR
jgi:hypothetical protein